MIFRFVILFLFISFNLYSADCEKPKMPTDEEWNSWLSNIKDTGKIIPGHGGLLDRLDGMIFAFPFSYLMFSIII